MSKTVGTYSLGKELVVREIKKQVFPTAPSPTRTTFKPFIASHPPRMQSMNTRETVYADWKEAAVLRLLYAVILLLKIALTAEMYKNSNILK